MSLADTVERLRMEYSAQIEYTFDSRARGRKLKCSFCNRQGIHEPFSQLKMILRQQKVAHIDGKLLPFRVKSLSTKTVRLYQRAQSMVNLWFIDPCDRPYKYQVVLDEHVVQHMNKLKELTDDERLQFLRKVFKINSIKLVT